MYREEDINIIKNNIDNIAQDAMTIYKTNYEPTLDESNKVYTELLNFIKEKKRIIYGGYAQNSLILMKNINDGFYKEIDTPDIEFYSHEPLVDLINLCDILNKKFKFVQGSEGLHEGTYKIFVNFVNYCDITYIPKNIYDNCPYIEDKSKKLRFAHPNFMLIDIYRVFTDPMTSYWRLEKSFKRYLRVYKYYPITSNNSNIKFNNFTSEEILRTIRKKIIHNSNYIVIGSYAYNYYLKKNNYQTIKINFYELICENIDVEAKKIYEILNKAYNKKINVKEYYPFFEFFDYRIEFLYDDKVILKLYNNNNRCIVYNESSIKKTKFGTCQLVLLYLISNYNYCLINRDSSNANNYLNMFINLIKCKNDYLDKYNLNVLDRSPFQEFILKCIGKPVDLNRLDRLEGIKKKKEGKPLKFRYDPKETLGKPPNYIFPNTSGNQVINNKFLIIKI
jgi:hypothetical protein